MKKREQEQQSNREWLVEKKLSTFFQTQNLNQTMIKTNNLDNFTSEQFKLINKMSKMVKYTNNSVNDVIGTLNFK